LGNIWSSILKKKDTSKEDQKGEDYSNLLLSEFAKRNIALPIYSEFLNCEVWLCSDSEMEKQIQSDDPEAITYTLDEVRDLIRLKPDPQELRKINDIKALFRGSKIISSKLNEHNLD